MVPSFLLFPLFSILIVCFLGLFQYRCTLCAQNSFTILNRATVSYFLIFDPLGISTPSVVSTRCPLISFIYLSSSHFLLSFFLFEFPILYPIDIFRFLLRLLICVFPLIFRDLAEWKLKLLFNLAVIIIVMDLVTFGIHYFYN